MRVCCCTLAGTKVCEHCYNNTENYTWSTKTTISIPIGEDFTKEDYKEILKYLIDKKEAF